MRNNSRIIKPLIYTDIQLLTLHLIGIYFHSNISLHNIDNITSFHLKEGSILINTCDGKRHKITDNVSELFEALL